MALQEHGDADFGGFKVVRANDGLRDMSGKMEKTGSKFLGGFA